MSLAIPPENLERFTEPAIQKYDVESTVIGEFNTSKIFQFYYDNKLIGEIPMEFLHNGVPQKKMKGKWEPIQDKNIEVPDQTDYNALSKQDPRSIKYLFQRGNCA